MALQTAPSSKNCGVPRRSGGYNREHADVNSGFCDCNAIARQWRFDAAEKRISHEKYAGLIEWRPAARGILIF